MEGLRRRVGSGSLSAAFGVVVFMCAVLVMVPEVSATRWIVGSNRGWSSNFNYTIWTQDKHFYNGDWLFFLYNRHQMDVLEVNKTNYELCNAEHPLHNWTAGAGRDVVPLNVTRHYYFISGKGFCFGGMKVAIRVENPPPPPSSQPLNEKNSAPKSAYQGLLVSPPVLAIGAVWDAFVRFW